MFPLFTKLIMTKEQEIKLLIKNIFDEISKEMNIPIILEKQD